MKANKQGTLQFLKKVLTLLGARMSPNRLWQLQMIVNYMKLGRWMLVNGFNANKRVRDRYEVFNAVIDQIANKKTFYTLSLVSTQVIALNTGPAL